MSTTDAFDFREAYKRYAVATDKRDAIRPLDAKSEKAFTRANDEVQEAAELIHEAPPKSQNDAAIKLRVLIRPDFGITALNSCEAASFVQVRDFIDESSASHSFDAQLATAYRDLENTIGNIRNACLLLDMAADETVFAMETEIEKWVRSKIGGDGMPGYAIEVFTKDGADALCYALHHLGDLIYKLYADYHAGFPDPAVVEKEAAR